MESGSVADFLQIARLSVATRPRSDGWVATVSRFWASPTREGFMSQASAARPPLTESDSCESPPWELNFNTFFLKVAHKRVNASDVGCEVPKIREQYTSIQVWHYLRVTNLVACYSAVLKTAHQSRLQDPVITPGPWDGSYTVSIRSENARCCLHRSRKGRSLR